MRDDDEAKPKTKIRKPGQWSFFDILLAIFGLAALIALAIAGFRVAKWVAATYL